MAEKKMVTKTVTTEEVVHKKKASGKKKIVKKKYPKKKKSSSPRKSAHVIRVEAQLMENFVSIQKVLTYLTKGLDENTKKMGDFLELFEESAKAFVKNSPNSSSENSKDNWQEEVTDKIDNLFEQNKVLARGLTLIHDEALKIKDGSSVKVKSPIVAVPVKAETSAHTPGLRESGENFRLNNKPRVKEDPNFDIQTPPFSIER